VQLVCQHHIGLVLVMFAAALMLKIAVATRRTSGLKYHVTVLQSFSLGVK
jgi:hypothetical protein